MMRMVIVLALLAVGAAAAPASSSTWPTQQFVKWERAWGSRALASKGVMVSSRRCGEDRPASEGCTRGDPYLVVTMSDKDMTPLTLESPPGVAHYLGIGTLTAHADHPALILVTDSGGSGGCATIDMAVPAGGAYRHVRLSVEPSDHGSLCPVNITTLEWPRDRTGHGRAEFLLPDGRFQCVFTSCAATWYPPQVIALDGQHGVDVSTDPALAPLFRADMIAARRACQQRKEEAQGACAGYALDAARLGKLPEAWRTIDAQMRRGCRDFYADHCPDINLIPASFPTRLAAALRRGGFE